MTRDSHDSTDDGITDGGIDWHGGDETGVHDVADSDWHDEVRSDDTGRSTGSAGRTGAQRRSEWRRGEKARRYAARNSVRFPIFTRSVLLWLLIFALTGLAFGASGAFWWAHFNSQVSQLRQDTQNFEARSQQASGEIEKQRQDALSQIDSALKPLQGFLSETQILQMSQSFSPAVYFVSTLDNEGMASVGTAFAVLSDDRESYLVTSYTTVAAATTNPGPKVVLHKGTEEFEADVWNWDPDNDLALLKVARGGIEVLEWAADEDSARAVGGRVFPVAGLGGAGASLTTGVIVDTSSVGFQHTSPLGTAWQGAPIVNGDGKVLGIASLTYEPLGFASGDVHFAPPIAAVCTRVLACGAVREPADPGGQSCRTS